MATTTHTTQPQLLLLSATQNEARGLLSEFVGQQYTEHLGKTSIQGTLAGKPCRLVYTGIGVVNTAHALTCQFEAELPALVIQFGIAGAYVPARLPIASVALATEENYGDVGVITPDGWKPADEIGIPLVPGDDPLFNRFPLDLELVERAAQLCGASYGPFVTVSQCTGVQALGDTLHHRFGALCESMEGAAAAHICALYNVPFLEVRGISNLVEDRARARWNIVGAATVAQQAVMKIVEHEQIM
jgi:futalosine hydrolase